MSETVQDHDRPAAPLPPHAHGEALPILVVPHPVLKAKARPVLDTDRETVAAALPRMFRTMYEAPGIGLAAPQVGIGLRVAVVDLAEGDSFQPIALINPEIVSVSEEWHQREEGCLSLPGLYAEVSRPVSVTVRYRDADWVPRTLTADGLLATCLQHEIDHLDGVLFVDHLSALKRNMLLRKLAKERRQKDADGP